ncbi:MAG: hypothetical protein ACRDJO_12235 [Actinomycetota bacterium]
MRESPQPASTRAWDDGLLEKVLRTGDLSRRLAESEARGAEPAAALDAARERIDSLERENAALIRQNRVLLEHLGRLRYPPEAA